MSIIVKTLLLLSVSNVFMLCAWYLHLKWIDQKHWFIAAMLSWGIAFFEYNFHIPLNIPRNIPFPYSKKIEKKCCAAGA